MKGKIFFLAIVFFTLKIQAQVFTSKINIEFNSLPEPTVLASADLNGDGFNDLISYDSQNGKIYFNLYNPSKKSEFDSKIFLANVPYCESIVSFDADGDGLTDVFATSASQNTVYFFKNNGDLTFDTQIIDNQAQGAVRILPADIDNDALTDILVISKLNNKVVWYKNNGGGSFSNANLIADYDQLPLYFAAADFDNDGDLDVAVAYGLSKEIFIYENQNADFQNRYLIATVNDIPSDLRTADFNNDGFADLLFVGKGNANIFWFENEGYLSDFQQYTIADYLPAPVKIDIGDYDLDFDEDLVVSVYSKNKLFLIRNQNGDFSDTLSMPIFEETPDPVIISDFNADNLPDLAVGIRGNDRLFWFKNGGESFLLHPIDLQHDGWSLEVTDIDNDGLTDIFYSNSSELFMAKNTNNGDFDGYTTLFSGFYNLTDIKAADLNNDGYKDLLLTDAMGDMFYYVRNSNGNLSNPQIIDDSEDGIFTVKTADYDNDGDLDLLVSAINSDKIIVYENTGNFNFTKHIIATGINAYSLDFLDVDNDGDLDIVFSEYQYIGCYYNENGSFSNPGVITNQYGYAYNLERSDLNNDGQDDFVVNLSALMYFRNNSGSFLPDTIHIHWDYCYNFDIADADNDGDFDLAATERAANEIQYVENINFADTFSYFIFSVNSPQEVKIAEINNDNAKDLVIGSWSDPGIYWAENYLFKIYRQPFDYQACAGENACFSILVNGAVQFQWQKYNGSDFENLTDNETYSGTNTALLTIKNVSQDMFGEQYRCVLTNKYGNQIVSEPAVLNEFQPYVVCKDTIVRQADVSGIYIPENGEFDPDTLIACQPGIYVVKNGYNNWTTLDGEQFQPGTYEINWIVFDQDNNALDTCKTVIIINAPAKVPQISDFGIYPNPAGDKLIIKGLKNIEKIEITGLTGKKLIQSANPGSFIDISILRPGMYILKVKTNEGNYVKKFVKY